MKLIVTAENYEMAGIAGQATGTLRGRLADGRTAPACVLRDPDAEELDFLLDARCPPGVTLAEAGCILELRGRFLDGPDAVFEVAAGGVELLRGAAAALEQLRIRAVASQSQAASLAATGDIGAALRELQQFVASVLPMPLPSPMESAPATAPLDPLPLKSNADAQTAPVVVMATPEPASQPEAGPSPEAAAPYGEAAAEAAQDAPIADDTRASPVAEPEHYGPPNPAAQVLGDEATPASSTALPSPEAATEPLVTVTPSVPANAAAMEAGSGPAVADATPVAVEPVRLDPSATPTGIATPGDMATSLPEEAEPERFLDPPATAAAGLDLQALVAATHEFHASVPPMAEPLAAAGEPEALGDAVDPAGAMLPEAPGGTAADLPVAAATLPVRPVFRRPGFAQARPMAQAAATPPPPVGVPVAANPAFPVRLQRSSSLRTPVTDTAPAGAAPTSAPTPSAATPRVEHTAPTYARPAPSVRLPPESPETAAARCLGITAAPRPAQPPPAPPVAAVDRMPVILTRRSSMARPPENQDATPEVPAQGSTDTQQSPTRRSSLSRPGTGRRF